MTTDPHTLDEIRRLRGREESLVRAALSAAVECCNKGCAKDVETVGDLFRYEAFDYLRDRLRLLDVAAIIASTGEKP